MHNMVLKRERYLNCPTSLRVAGAIFAVTALIAILAPTRLWTSRGAVRPLPALGAGGSILVGSLSAVVCIFSQSSSLLSCDFLWWTQPLPSNKFITSQRIVLPKERTTPLSCSFCDLFRGGWHFTLPGSATMWSKPRPQGLRKIHVTSSTNTCHHLWPGCTDTRRSPSRSRESSWRSRSTGKRNRSQICNQRNILENIVKASRILQDCQRLNFCSPPAFARNLTVHAFEACRTFALPWMMEQFANWQ